MRILSYNIHKGFSFGNIRFLLEEIRHGIRLVNADLVFLQEVVGENVKKKKQISNWEPQQFEYLADTMWPHYAYGKNAMYSEGHHGNAILSQFPLAEYNNIDVSLLPTSQRGMLYGKTVENEQTPSIHLLCLHFGLFAFERRRQIRKLCLHIKDIIPVDAPLIIAGDFNDWAGDSDITLREAGFKEAFFEKHGHLAKTFPASFPLFTMDRIYYRNLRLVDAEVLSGDPWNKLSDHCAVYAEFDYD